MDFKEEHARNVADIWPPKAVVDLNEKILLPQLSEVKKSQRFCRLFYRATIGSRGVETVFMRTMSSSRDAPSPGSQEAHPKAKPARLLSGLAAGFSSASPGSEMVPTAGRGGSALHRQEHLHLDRGCVEMCGVQEVGERLREGVRIMAPDWKRRAYHASSHAIQAPYPQHRVPVGAALRRIRSIHGTEIYRSVRKGLAKSAQNPTCLNDTI